MRAALYARYSTDHQDERSIDDQLRLCRELVTRAGGDVVATFADYAISGAGMKNRPQILALLERARAGEFDTVIAEALDRLSRDQEDVAGIFKRLRFAGVAIVTASEGKVDEIHIGLKGTMNALYIRETAAKVRRGQRGRVADGLVAGGRAYGYDVLRELDAHGNLKRGLRTINEAEAAIVRRIFAAYAAGRSGRAIAAELNREGVPTPGAKSKRRTRPWSASTINGSRARGRGILWNEIYIGKLVWNRTTVVKDPDTGKRLARLNPAAERVTVDVPHLRIIDDEIWRTAQAIKAERGASRPLHMHRRPRHLFSGLVHCAACGGPYVVRVEGRLGCAHHHAEACDNGSMIAVAALERRVLEGLRSRALAPDVVAAYAREYHAERQRLAAEGGRKREALEAALAETGRQLEKVVDAICQVGINPTLRTRLEALEADKARFSAELEALAPAPAIVLHPQAGDYYRRSFDSLQEALAGDAQARAEAGTALRRLVARIDVHPAAPRQAPELRLHGAVVALLALASQPKAGTHSGLMVAEGMGFEPTIRL